MASFNLSSFLGVRQCLTVAAIVCCIILCVPMTTTALPLKDVVGQAMEMARQQQHREKRAVTKTPCEQPSNLQDMFQQINSGVNGSQFLNKAINGEAITIPASEKAKVIEGDPNETKTCPSSLTTDPSAPLAHRSLCPYYFDILQLPQGYYPPTLHWARCKCATCIQNDAYGCEEIVTNIAVLKPIGCFQGMQKYQEEIIPVNTACACAFSGGVAAQTTTAATTTTTTAASGGWGDV